MDLGIKDRVAIVTGGSRGLGRQAALSLAREGVKVAICARTEGTLKDTVQELKVMEKAGRDIPEDVRETQPRGKGIDSMVEVVSKTWAKHGHEAREQEIRDIVAYVFDSEGEAKDN